MLSYLQNYEGPKPTASRWDPSIFRWAVSSHSEQSHPDVLQRCQQTYWQTQTQASTNRCRLSQRIPTTHAVNNTPKATQTKTHIHTYAAVAAWLVGIILSIGKQQIRQHTVVWAVSLSIYPVLRWSVTQEGCFKVFCFFSFLMNRLRNWQSTCELSQMIWNIKETSWYIKTV